MSRAERWVYPRGLIDPPTDLSEPQRPLQLHERGIWDPAEQYWGEPDGLLEICLVEVIAAGPRLRFELEQLLPGGEDPDAPAPILEAVALRDRGQPAGARALLEGLIEWDCRWLDAHAHLGALDFDDDPGAAQAHDRDRRADRRKLAAGGLRRRARLGLDRQPPIPTLPARPDPHRLAARPPRPGTSPVPRDAVVEPADNQGARDLLSEITTGEAWHARR